VGGGGRGAVGGARDATRPPETTGTRAMSRIRSAAPAEPAGRMSTTPGPRSPGPAATPGGSTPITGAETLAVAVSSRESSEVRSAPPTTAAPRKRLSRFGFGSPLKLRITIAPACASARSSPGRAESAKSSTTTASRSFTRRP
jgi:hypothetical protein